MRCRRRRRHGRARGPRDLAHPLGRRDGLRGRRPLAAAARRAARAARALEGPLRALSRRADARVVASPTSGGVSAPDSGTRRSGCSQLGLALTLASAVATNVGFLLRHRGAVAAPAVDIRRPLHSAAGLFRSKWWTLGYIVAAVAYALHVGALALAPLSVVQAVLAGGLVLLGVIAERWFGFHLGRREWTGVVLAAAGLVCLTLTRRRDGRWLLGLLARRDARVGERARRDRDAADPRAPHPAPRLAQGHPARRRGGAAVHRQPRGGQGGDGTATACSTGRRSCSSRSPPASARSSRRRARCRSARASR